MLKAWPVLNTGSQIMHNYEEMVDSSEKKHKLHGQRMWLAHGWVDGGENDSKYRQ